MSYISAGSSAGVFTVLGTPRARTTEVADGIIQEHHALGQFALDQNRGVRGDPAGAAEEVVEAIMKEERIRRVLRQALGDFCRVDRPVIA